MDLVIFDCDGVLVDSEILACRVCAGELSRSGFPITTEQLAARFCGMTELGIRDALERDFGRPFPEDLWPRCRVLVGEAFQRELQPIAGVAAALDAIAGARCVASSSPPGRIRLALELTGLYQRLAPHLYSATQVARGKPAPDLFLHAAASMGAEPRRCLVVEDSIVGVRAAVAAGMTAVGFTGAGHCTPALAGHLREAGADHLIAEMAALPGLIAALRRPL